MNTHDIELPPLPYPQIPGNDYTSSDMKKYARAAIEADRKRRGEPVAWRTYDRNGWYVFSLTKEDAERDFPGRDHKPLYTAPQPAEPVKVPRDDEIIQMMVRRGWKHLDDEDRTDIVMFARALIARYTNVSKSSEEIDTSAERVDDVDMGQPAASAEPVARVNNDGFIVETGLSLAPGTLLFSAPTPPAGEQAQPPRLYQHDDGRYGLSFGPARFAAGDPAWHRVPIDITENSEKA